MRVRAVPDPLIRLILVEAEMNKCFDEIAGLRNPLRDDKRHASRQRVRRAGVIFCRASKIRNDITGRRESDAQDRWVFGCVTYFIEKLRIKTVFQTNFVWI